MKTLRLTSPPHHGADVSRVQMLLNGHNAFKTDFLPGRVDSVFGQVTAAACVHAKRYIGYTDATCLPVAGDLLCSYLDPDHPRRRTPAMIARAALRRRKATDAAWRAKLVQIARREIGVKEEPAGSNNGPRVRQYEAVTGTIGEPWCAAFQSWVLRQAGYKGHLPDSPAWVPGWHMTATAHKYGFRVIAAQDAEAGDWVLYNWERGTPADNGVDDHIGLVETPPTRTANDAPLKAIEGNTSVGNDSNGGEVMLRDRTLRPVAAFVRKAWS